MAINTQKLLPAAKSGAIVKSSKSNIKASKLLKGGALVKSVSAITKQSSSSITEQTQENFEVIKVKVIELDSLFKGTLALEKKNLDQQKKQDATKGREKQEEKLETKPKMKFGSVKMPKLPKMGFLDWIKNYISNVILGYFAVRMVDYLPLLKPIIKFLGNATDFIIDNGGKLLDGLVTFIDWGYKAYDATGGFIKNLFGEDGVKQFTQLSGLLNKFLSLALIAGMVGAGSGGFGGKGKGKGGGLGGRGGRPKVTTSGGRSLGKPDLKNPLRQKPKITAGGKPQLRLPGTAAKVTGGSKGLLRSVRPFLKRLPIPIIGALIDFGLSVALGEDPGRAAFRAIGAGLLGAVGAAAGTIVPVAGNFIGGLVGGLAGDAIGGALYDMFFAGKIPSKGKTTKKAGGGITRGGKKQGRAQRTITKGKRGKINRTITPRKPGTIEINAPGSAVGGEDKLFGIFPNPFTAAKKVIDAVNPFKNVKDAATELGKSDYFGPILAISSKITAGQLPTQQDYQNVGLGINLLIAQGIRQKQLKGGLVSAFAEGGLVDPDVLSAAETGGDVSNWVAKTFKGEVESNAQKTLRMIRENAEKKELEKGPDKSDPTLDTGGDQLPPGGITKGQWGPLLDLIAGKESGGNYEAMYPSTTLKGATKMTIAEVARRASGVVGKYQQLPQYLVGRAKAAGLNPDKDLYSPENQEKIIINVNIKGRGGQKWLENKISDDQFMQGLSQEFASLPNAQGKFYYSGQRSAMTPQKVKAALARVKKGGYSQADIAAGMKGKGGADISLGKGYGSSGSKIAGELGRFIKSKLKSPAQFQAVTEHPEHGGVRGRHAQNSYHYSGRAIDIGAYTYEQGPILAAVREFNKMKGVSPVELIDGRKDPGGHGDHVHVAYEVGGETLPYPHLAMIGEKGSEIVIDADSAGPAKDMLLAINQAKGYKGVMKAIQQYAPYDTLAPQTIVIPVPQVSSDSSGSGDSIGLNMLGSFSKDDPFESLYVGG